MNTAVITENVREVIEGVCPSKSNCYRVTNNFFYKTSALKDFENKFFIQCRNRDRMITGYFEILLKVFYPNERSDLDNSLKVIMDCLQSCKVIKNDNRCVKIVAEKYLDKNRPRIEFELREI